VARGVPSTAELTAALRGFLAEDVMPATEGRLSFTARIAANVAAAVEREIVIGPVQAARHRERLTDLGFDSNADLAEAIHAGELDDRLDELTAALLPDAVERLGLWNPGYVAPEDADLMLPAPAPEGEAPEPKNLDQEGR
jgi:Domain of unknown function (DUF6285)